MNKPLKVQITKPRFSKMYMGIWGVNHLYRNNPLVAAWWSAALPGFGHMSMGMYLKGAIFLTGEILMNFFGKINLALFYTFNLQWDKVHEVINYDYALVYASIWVYSIWDSYRLAVEVNKLEWLESKQNVRHFEHDVIRSIDMNFLDKRNPWVGLAWSCAFTGLGHVYCHKLLFGFILTSWAFIISLNTHLPTIIIYTFIGQVENIPQLVNYQWLLFFPSVYLFGVYHGYNSVIVHNQVFKEEQAYFLRVNFGSNKLDII
ncbi:hypothetical protein [Bacillus marasmi]|uniref:hypothetical protein n=1 Tax=Bacillus marasmi TaxID=1926279 RepID=UPI0011C82400|nr:hypothetical protein [Bacillus marasmi]